MIGDEHVSGAIDPQPHHAMTPADPNPQDSTVTQTSRDSRDAAIRRHADQIDGIDEVDGAIRRGGHPADVAKLPARNRRDAAVRRSLADLVLLANGEVAVAGRIADEAVAVIETGMRRHDVDHAPVRRSHPHARTPRVERFAVVPEMFAIEHNSVCTSTKFVRMEVGDRDRFRTIRSDAPHVVQIGVEDVALRIDDDADARMRKC